MQIEPLRRELGDDIRLRLQALLRVDIQALGGLRDYGETLTLLRR
jgi:hypothetical protein